MITATDLRIPNYYMPRLANLDGIARLRLGPVEVSYEDKRSDYALAAALGFAGLGLLALCFERRRT